MNPLPAPAPSPAARQRSVRALKDCFIGGLPRKRGDTFVYYDDPEAYALDAAGERVPVQLAAGVLQFLDGPPPANLKGALPQVFDPAAVKRIEEGAGAEVMNERDGGDGDPQLPAPTKGKGGGKK